MQRIAWEDLLDGLLMSDGNLTIPGQCRSPRYQQTCKEPSFLEWVSSWLPTHAHISGPHRSGRYQYYLLSTRTHSIYAPIYRRWYPDRKKILPHDLKITPSLLLTEYLGDGHLVAIPETKTQRIELGTYGFDRPALLDLLLKLAQQSLLFRIKANNGIWTRGSRVKTFLDYIGQCPVPALAYKWQYFDVEEYLWRRIIRVEVQDTVRIGAAVNITLECGHSIRKPASRLRSDRTNMMICRQCQ